MHYQREMAHDVFKEMLPLLSRHKDEIAHYKDIEFEPDEEFYLQSERAGILRVYTVRTPERKLIGYGVFFLKNNPHYKSSKQAVQDVIFIDKDYRGIGSSFIDFCDEQLKSERAQAVYHHVKSAHNWGPMLERKGYELVDLIYARRLD